MESNPALGFLGFWMMMQLIATLALLIGGIYLMFCLGRAASGLDRMANAMEDWVLMEQSKLQQIHAAPRLPQTGSTQTGFAPMNPAQTSVGFDLSTPGANAPAGSTPGGNVPAAHETPLNILAASNLGAAPIPNPPASASAPVPFTPAATPQSQSQSQSESQPQPQPEYSRPDEPPRF